GQMRLARRAAYANASAFLCGQAAIFLVLLAAAGAFSLHISALAAVGILFLTVAAFESAGALTRAGLQAGVMGAAARRVVEVAASTPNATQIAAQTDAPEDTHIHLEGVKFRWAPDRPLVFDGLTLDIPAGARIAILGPSGVGKSSLAALLLKAAVPEAGSITLGGEEISHIKADSLRRRMAWLSQATHLFDDSIRANLLLGRPDATEDDLWKALEDAAVADVVKTLPDGLDTWLGEGGIKLSGGQGRRIALARTLLTQAPILILDEPATGLDAQTEQDFLRTLNTVTSGRTVILIAHRLTGVETLDRIWRLSGGVATAAAA
ncbi:MAG: ATP-binding cassette domain-containing protein, partial [Acetobacter malorum]